MDLYEACENGNEERVVELLVLGPSTGIPTSPASQLRTRGIAGRTPLLAACVGGQANVVRLLLGERAIVYFTSRTEDEVQKLLQPLVDAVGQGSRVDDVDPLFEVTMATKDDGVDVVPMVEVQLPPEWVVAPNELLEGNRHVDDFGNTPLQCVSCFGCGSSVKHVDDGLEITRQLLLHGDQPNKPKTSNKWTSLHWGAYNGNHDQVTILLDPVANIGKGLQRFAKTQISIPLLTDSDNLFAVDVAGRRGLALRDEMRAVRRAKARQNTSIEHVNSAYIQWRLRLDHVKVVRLFICEFLENGEHLVRYVGEMNARNPQQRKRNRNSKSSIMLCQTAVRYGQHLLYWAGCFGLVDEVRLLLRLEMKMSTVGGSSGGVNSSVIKPVIGSSTGDKEIAISLQVLYTCSCEANKRQSVLHAVAAHGQVEILKLLLEKLLRDQQYSSDTASFVVTPMVNKAKKNLVVPSTEAELSKLSDGPEAENESNEHLETAELVNAGWKNYRNESPLFAAVLYLQEKAVTMFATALSPSSLRWELQNVNVEGSSLHHVVSGASRQILNIEHQSARPEYVMIFDGVKKKQFKESIIETLREESSLAPSLVATRAGKREVDDSTCKKKKRTDYLVLGATDEVLIQQAQVLQLKVKHRGSSTRSKYDVGSPELFESFRSLQRQQVIHSIIQRKINLKKHLQNGNIMTIFPLHDEIGCRNIVRHWGYTDDSHRVFQPFAGNSLEEFVFERKKHQYEMLWPLLTYFGEKHTFYYAFVAFYTVWLLPIALLGVICQTLWLVDNASFMPPLFAIVVSIWATLLVERWKRKRSEIQRKFGHFRRNRSEGMPGFYGDFQVESTLQRANATVDVKFPRALQLARIYSGIPLLLIMGVGVVAIFVVVKANIMSSTVVHNTIPWLPMFLVPYVVPLLNAVSMLLLDNLYTRLAQALTKWENHRTVWQFESMLAVKLFWFKFLNAFISLFWIAFVDQNAVALRKQLLIVMGVRQLWNSIMRDLVPTFIVRYRWKQAGFRFRSASRKAHWWSSASHEWYNAELSTPVAIASEIQAPPPFVLLQELMYPHDFLMGKQMEAVLQFGYITMFVSVLPVAPLLALLSNAVAMRLEVLSCTRAKQRPPFESETEVSSFMNILEFMSFAAVAVNCAVLFFTTRTDFESLVRVVAPGWTEEFAKPDNTKIYVKELWILLVIEHVVLGMKALLSLTIDDSASWVRLDEDQSDEEEKKRMLGTTRQGEIDPSSLSLQTDSQTLSNKDSTNQQAGTDSSLKSSKFNEALAKQYAIALQQREEALQREQIAVQKLEEWMKCASITKVQTTSSAHVNTLATMELSPSGIIAQTIASSVNAAETRSSLKPLTTREELLVIRGHCFLCSALRDLKKEPAKRCLSCHVASCLPCDEILHLDDLGVNEAPHFRVKTFVAELHNQEYATGKLTYADMVDSHATALAKRKRERSAKYEELRQCVDNFVTKYRRSEDPARQKQTTDEVLERCSINVRVALRYLRNFERQQLYQNSSNPVVTSAHTTASVEPKKA